MSEPTFYDGEGNSESFPPGDFAGGGHNTIIQAFGRDSERFANSQYAAVIHGQGLYRGYAEDSIDLSATAPGDTVSFAATPRRPWFVGGWLRAEAELDSTLFLEGEIQSYDPETGALSLEVAFTDGDVLTDSWKLLSQGQRGRSLEWKGDWASGTEHPIYAVVLHDGAAWIAPNGAAADEEPGHSSSWERITGDGMTFHGQWVDQAYSKNAAVYHRGGLWRATTDVSAGQEPGEDSVWGSITGQSPRFRGAWDSGVSDYQINDLTVLHGSTWVAEQTPAAGDEPGYSSVWARFAEGVKYRGAWQSGTSYPELSVVGHNNQSYIANENVPSDEEPGISSKWDLLVGGFRWRGDWDGATEYPPENIVQHTGSSWISTGYTAAGDEPGVSSKWSLFAERGDTGASTFDWQVITSDHNAAKDDRLLADATGGLQVLAPGTPQSSYQFEIADIAQTFGDGLTIDGNGQTVNGASSVTITHPGARLRLAYTGSEWQLRSDNSIDGGGTQQQVVVVDEYLATEELI